MQGAPRWSGATGLLGIPIGRSARPSRIQSSAMADPDLDDDPLLEERGAPDSESRPAEAAGPTVAGGGLYSVLGVDKTATAAQIKKGFMKKARKCHPDKFQNDPAKTREFQILNDGAAPPARPHSRSTRPPAPPRRAAAPPTPRPCPPQPTACSKTSASVGSTTCRDATA